VSKGNTFETDLLALIFNGTAIANLADNAASSPLTSLYLAFHTADPGEGGSQTTSEISYTGYARKAVARSSGQFSVSGNTATTVNDQDTGASSGGTGGTITHFSFGTASSGTGKILYSGTVTPNIVVASGVTPILKAGSTITED